MQNRNYQNYPIIIGAGQITHREKIRQGSLSVYDLIRQAVQVCAQDTGREDILRQLDALAVVSCVSEHKESPLPRVCEACGIAPSIQEETVLGGNGSQWLVNNMAGRIMRKELKLALLTGVEALYRDVYFLKLMRLDNFYKRYDDPRIVGDRRRWESGYELRHYLDRAPRFYPLFENALRAKLGKTPQAYREMLKPYFDNLAAIASGNPLAWFNKGKEFEDITEPTKKNPFYNYPYTKYMNPVLPVNQAAALIMTDTDTAMQLGIPREKWVYLCSGSDATDAWFISERINYYSSPVARLTSKAALETAGLSLADMNFFDLYTCFPCAPFITALELGLSLDNLPPISITGGLPFFGGPGNNYSMHSIAHAVARLRKHPEERGFITAWGSYLTKHSVGIYSGTQPERPWKDSDNDATQRQIDAVAKGPALCEQPNGPVKVETYTVLHDNRDGKPYAIIIALLESGERCLAVTHDPELTALMEQDEFVGRRGQVVAGGEGPNLFSL